MSHLTFAELIRRRVRVSAAEAAALTLAVARVMDAERAAGRGVRLPDDDWIILSSSGQVSLIDVHGSTEEDETAALSALLRRLLRLDQPHSSDRRGRIPGGLLIVLARNLGYIHLPATGPVAFRAALERFATPDPAVLAAVFWRAARVRSDRAQSGRGLLPAAELRRRHERRHRGSSPEQLRRALRELERELFELRSRSHAAESSAAHRGAARRWLPGALVVSAASILLIVGFASDRDAEMETEMSPAGQVVTWPEGPPAFNARSVGQTLVAFDRAPLDDDRTIADAAAAGQDQTLTTERSVPAARAVRSPKSLRAVDDSSQRSTASEERPATEPEKRRRRTSFAGGTRSIPFAVR